jgi:hypothetical protein
MELNEKIKTLEDEVKLMKTEMKSVLIDLRIALNNYENPFVNVRQLEKASEIKASEIKFKAETGNGGEVEEKYTKEEQESTIEPVEPSPEIEEITMPIVEEEKESAIEPVEPTINPDPASMTRSEMKKLAGERNIDILLLTRLMNWTDNSLYTIGKEKLNAILNLYDFTGSLAKEMKDLIIKISELSTAKSTPADNDVEMKNCIQILYQLDKIISGENRGPILLPEDEGELEQWLKV